MKYFGLQTILIIFNLVFSNFPITETKICGMCSGKMKEEKSIYRSKNGFKQIRNTENFTIDFATITPDNDADNYKLSNEKRKLHLLKPRNAGKPGFFISLKNVPKTLRQDRNTVGHKMEKAFHKRQERKAWDQWSAWSECSATCGVGRSVRWRHCIDGGCETEEKEAQLKLCASSRC